MNARQRALTMALLALAMVTFGPTSIASANVAITTKLDGSTANNAAGAKPIRLEPGRKIPLRVEVYNAGPQAVTIQHVRFEGAALGLKFLTYDATVSERVPAGQRRTVTVPLDLFDVDDQATGYLNASVRIFDGKRRELAAQSFVVDVRGKVTSVLSLFAFGLLGLAIVSVVGITLNAARRRLSRNRALRGFQFMVAGSAVGLSLAAGLPILRLTIVQSDAWVPFALGPMAIGFALGYLAPGPISMSIEQTREDELLDLFASQAVERLSAEHTAAITAQEGESYRGGETVLVGAGVTREPHSSGATIVAGAPKDRGAYSHGETVVTGVPASVPAEAGATTVVPTEASSAHKTVVLPELTDPGDDDSVDRP